MGFTYYGPITARISLEIKKAGRTEREIAEKIGISAARLNHYLNGRREIPVGILGMIASELKVSIDYLYGFKKQSKGKGK